MIYLFMCALLRLNWSVVWMQGLHGNDQVMTGYRREQNGWIKLLSAI